MNERNALITSCLADWADDLPKLVLADWLDEHGEDSSRLRWWVAGGRDGLILEYRQDRPADLDWQQDVVRVASEMPVELTRLICAVVYQIEGDEFRRTEWVAAVQAVELNLLIGGVELPHIAPPRGGRPITRMDDHTLEEERADRWQLNAAYLTHPPAADTIHGGQGVSSFFLSWISHCVGPWGYAGGVPAVWPKLLAALNYLRNHRLILKM